MATPIDGSTYTIGVENQDGTGSYDHSKMVCETQVTVVYHVGSLPATGSNSDVIVLVALSGIAVGGALVLLRRRSLSATR